MYVTVNERTSCHSEQHNYIWNFVLLRSKQWDWFALGNVCRIILQVLQAPIRCHDVTFGRQIDNICEEKAERRNAVTFCYHTNFYDVTDQWEGYISLLWMHCRRSLLPAASHNSLRWRVLLLWTPVWEFLTKFRMINYRPTVARQAWHDMWQLAVTHMALDFVKRSEYEP